MDLIFENELLQTEAINNVPQRVALELITDIENHTACSIGEIANSCHIKVKELLRIKYGHPATIPNQIFERILSYYCYIFYDENGQKIKTQSSAA